MLLVGCVHAQVRDLDFPITIIGVPIAREPDGLAMSRLSCVLAEYACSLAAQLPRRTLCSSSANGPFHCFLNSQAGSHALSRLLACVLVLRSRNARLSPESRSNALSISEALKWAEGAVAKGEVVQVDDIAGTVRQRIAAAGGDVDYVEVSERVRACLRGTAAADRLPGHSWRFLGTLGDLALSRV